MSDTESEYTSVTAAELSKTYHSFSMVILRGLATVIDLSLLIGTMVLGQWLLGDETYQRVNVLFIVFLFAYYPLLESYWGLTVGKLALGLRVVNKSGGLPSLLQALIRAALKFIELFFALLPAIVILISDKNQRIGDMITDTYVVKSRDIS